MHILSLRKSQLFTFDEWLDEVNNPAGEPDNDLEKALFKHAYYSKLVPTVITGKDGVKRIHWVNPDKDKKTKKMNLVAHFHEGERDEHHKQIKKDNEIDLDHLHHLSHGDKVRVARGKYKGQVGIFAGSYPTAGNSSPRASVKFQDADGKWKTADPIGATSLELLHRANEQTKAAIAPKTVEHINRKGQKTVVSKKWKDKAGAAAPAETPQERHERLSKEIGKGILFRRASDGVNIFIADERGDKLHIKILNASSKSGKKEGWVEKDRFKKLVEDGSYNRAGMSKLGKDTDQKLTRKLETGELHLEDKVTYDEHGQPHLDPEIAKDIVWENWNNIERMVSAQTANFPTVDESEISGIDFLDKLRNALDSFEPYLNTSVQSRLNEYAKDAAKKKASQLHQINLLRERKDMLTDRTNDPDGTIAASDGEDEEGVAEDMAPGGFINKLDAMIFKDIVDEEAELIKWHVGNDEYVDAVMRMTGFGIGEPQITRQEAIRDLYGRVKSADGKPLKQNTIDSHLSRVYNEIVETFKNEAASNADFAHTVKTALEYRAKIRRKRALSEYNSKDYPTIKAMRHKYDGGRNARSAIAAKLIKHGAGVSAAPKMVEITEKIIGGQLVPHDYKNVFGSAAEAKIMEDTLKDLLPADAGRTPDRFKIVEWYNHNPKGDKPSLTWLTAKNSDK